VAGDGVDVVVPGEADGAGVGGAVDGEGVEDGERVDVVGDAGTTGDSSGGEDDVGVC
jgi:hypothetical protein